jgi:hypothetical protein
MLDVQAISWSAIIHRSEDLTYFAEVAYSPPLRTRLPKLHTQL